MHKRMNELPVEPEGFLQLEMMQVLINGNHEWVQEQDQMFLQTWLIKAEELIEQAADRADQQYRDLNGAPQSIMDHKQLQDLRRQARDEAMAEFSETPSLVSSLISEMPSQSIN